MIRVVKNPTHSAITIGFQDRALYGSYAQLQAVSTRISRLARTERFLWDIGISSTTFVQVKGALRSTSSSFAGIGFDLHLTAPLFFALLATSIGAAQTLAADTTPLTLEEAIERVQTISP